MEKVTENDVAIIVPLSTIESLTREEKISLQHLKTHLGKYDKYYVASTKTKLDHVDLSGFKVKRFSPKFFGSAIAHSRLLADRGFYRSFNKYRYILIYHLDALVFSDQLLYWCERNYDYIAPPWMSSELKWADVSAIGNGGFSLRNVDTFIRLYSSNVQWEEPKVMAEKVSSKIPVVGKLFYPFGKLLFKGNTFNNIRAHFNRFLTHINSGEDRFIAKYALKYLPDFKFCPVDEAVSFAFETSPEKSYELNDKKLPFGCHAFERYDYSFWKPFLLEVG